jgi:hypothetical protein
MRSGTSVIHNHVGYVHPSMGSTPSADRGSEHHDEGFMGSVIVSMSISMPLAYNGVDSRLEGQAIWRQNFNPSGDGKVPIVGIYPYQKRSRRQSERATPLLLRSSFQSPNRCECNLTLWPFSWLLTRTFAAVGICGLYRLPDCEACEYPGRSRY